MEFDALAATQLLNLLTQEDVSVESTNKIPSLFTDISTQTFTEVLKQASEIHMAVLKKYAIAESLQYQLLLFCHGSAERLGGLERELISIEEEIADLDPNETGIKEKEAIEKRIHSLALQEQDYIKVMDKALAIAWNCERLDLIDCLSNAKERHQKVLLNLLKNDINAETNLYKILERHLHAIYGQPSNPADIQALKDEDPSIEALAKFGIWYLEDYFAIGLLPEVNELSQLELSPSHYKEEERIAHRRLLFQSARKELERLGLTTVSDLKKASIFSKRSLHEWIQMRKS